MGTSGSVKDHWYVDAGLQNIAATKNGYIFVYVSNESNLDVFFDNLQVIHKPGPLLEETHYYPFGLAMAGISSKAGNPNYVENKKKYNGIEFDNDLGINVYEAYYRTLDPQTGRWWQIDPMCEPNEDPDEPGLESLSPYNSMDNNPVGRSDPNGDCTNCAVIWQEGQAVSSGLPPQAQAVIKIGTGIVVGAVVLYELFKDTSLDDIAKSMATTGSTSVPAMLDLYVKSGEAKLNPPKPAVPNLVQATKKGPKDLAADGKAAIDKAAADKARAAQRLQQTAQGKVKEGKSNQGTRGSHAGGNDGETHDAAEARRAREQAAADAKKEADKKKT